MSLDATPQIRPANLGTVYGKKPWHGVLGLFGGLALLGVAAWLAATLGWRARSDFRGILILSMAGLASLGANFKVRGARITQGGLVVWNYLFWIVGRKRLVVPEEIESVVLGNEKGNFTVCARLRDGGECPIPGKWVTLKDAQAIIDLCTSLYRVSAGVAITDEKVLMEAAAFAAAKRWGVRPFKLSRKDGERLVFADEQGARMGEVGLWKSFLRSPRAGIAGGPGDLAANGQRWLLQKRFLKSRVRVTDGEREGQDVETVTSFLSDKLFYQWTDAAGVCWSAMFTTEQSKSRTPFTLRFYRGLAEDVGKEAQRKQVEQSQGAPVLVALANGPAANFTLDVADEQAWPWVRIALACVWLCHRPAFSFTKG